MTASGAEYISSQYLWVDARVTGAVVPEVGVLEHKIAGPWSASHEVHAHIVPSELVSGRWDVAISSTLDEATEALVELDGLHAAESIYRTVHRDVMTAAHIEEWTRLHAALIDCGGARVAIAGQSGAGKTTLALALALRGAQLHSDEGIFIRGEDAVGLPRRIHVKAGTFDVLPEIGIRELLRLPYEPAVWALDPTSLPTPPDRATAVRGIDVLVILDGWNDTTRIAPMPTALALQSLVEQSALWSDNHRLTLRNIAALLSNTACFTLTRQDLDSGIAAVEDLVASCVTRSI
ncbi:hypothetical protein ACFRFQ_09015 [Rhodococcus sp. NPDC056743]|uniref:hypothetical protein n=1 Tax=Rhodococcus sp. NPDC056743 TaxID=3345934 RepID=UPI00366C37AF